MVELELHFMQCNLIVEIDLVADGIASEMSETWKEATGEAR